MTTLQKDIKTPGVETAVCMGTKDEGKQHYNNLKNLENMKLNIELHHGNTPESIKARFEEEFPSCAFEIGEEYGCSVDLTMTAPDGQLACTLAGLMELQSDFQPWEIRIY